MKTKIWIVAVIALIMISLAAEAQSKKNENTKTVTFEVSMTCENCQRTIEKNIAWEKGMKDIKVDLEKKLVTLTFDTRKTSEEKLIEAFENLGYTAEAVQNNQNEKNVNKQ